MTKIRMRFDLRVPPFADTTFGGQHQAMLDMVTWAESIGIESVSLSEHHGDPAGFTSAPITVATAILARTSQIKVNIAAALVPLHDPVRLAEQLATIDCLAPGRLSLVLGAGYRNVEFEMAGIDRRQRGQLVEECLEVLRAAWTGQPFQYRGREVVVTPTPETPGGPKIYVGGKSVAAARRAARFHAGFRPAAGDFDVIGAYFEECERVGFVGADMNGYRSMAAFQSAQRPSAGDKPPLVGFVMVAENPDAVWKEIGPNAVYDAATYASWQDDAVHSDWVIFDASSWEDLRASGLYVVATPAECLALAERDGSLMLHPLMGGIAPELAWESLRLFEREVLPHLPR